jgi:3'-5' exoribonuclease
MQAVSSEFDKSAREGKGPNELTNKVWALDNRQLLNTKRWLEDDKQGE